MDTYEDLAEVNQGIVKLNRIFTSYVNRHQRGKITGNEIFDLVVKQNTVNGQDPNLPAEFQIPA